MKKSNGINERPQEIKAPKVVAQAVVLPWLLLAVLSSLVAGLIGGYFLHINMVGDARAEVTSSHNLLQAELVSSLKAQTPAQK